MLEKVVKVLESHKVQEMKLAQQVKKMLLESSLPIAGDEATRQHRKRSVLACVFYLCVFVHFQGGAATTPSPSLLPSRLPSAPPHSKAQVQV